jgi:predicted O-methyltransferase YrrM
MLSEEIIQDIYARGKTLVKRKEIWCLYYNASEIHARNILEIGSRYGCSSMTLAAVAKEQNGHLQSIEANPQELWRTNMDEMG